MLPKTKTIELAEKLGFIKENKSDWERSRASLNDIKDWLRETHKIHCSVAPWRDDSGIMSKDEMYEANVIDVNNNWRTDIVKSFFKDHYKCLEACITYSLQILKEKYDKEN